jgi:hypothetical protein
MGLAAYARVFTARASLLWRSGQHRPATVLAVDGWFAQQTAHQRAAAPAAAGTGADTGAFADLFEGFGAGLNRFEHGAFANLVTDTSGF